MKGRKCIMKRLFIFLLIIAFVSSTLGCATPKVSKKGEDDPTHQANRESIEKQKPWWDALLGVIVLSSIIAAIMIFLQPNVYTGYEED